MKMRPVVLALTFVLLASRQGLTQSKLVVLSSQANVASSLPSDCQAQAEVVGQALDLAPHAPDGYTLFRIQLVRSDDSHTQSLHLGPGPTARFVGNLFARGVKPRRL